MLDNGDELMKDDQAKRVLELIAHVFRKMQDRSIELRRLAQVDKVMVQFQPFQYQDRCVLEGYIDTFLKDGRSICWSIGVSWTPTSWMVETSMDERRAEDDVLTFGEETTSMESLEDIFDAINDRVEALAGKFEGLI
jgi:hypothetical protein